MRRERHLARLIAVRHLDSSLDDALLVQRERNGARLRAVLRRARVGPGVGRDHAGGNRVALVGPGDAVHQEQPFGVRIRLHRVHTFLEHHAPAI